MLQRDRSGPQVRDKDPTLSQKKLVSMASWQPRVVLVGGADTGGALGVLLGAAGLPPALAHADRVLSGGFLGLILEMRAGKSSSWKDDLLRGGAL